MKQQLNSNLLPSKSYEQKLIEATRGLVNKWSKNGLLEGINTTRERAGMAIVLENQARQLLKEASATGGEEWSNIALPLVRRVIGGIASKEFVSVQPMAMPTGLVFFLDVKYGTNQPGFNSGSSLYGGDNGVAGGGLFGRTLQANGGLYGAGKFGYSLNDQILSASIIGVPTATTASWFNTNFNTALSASAIAGSLKVITVSTTASINAPGVKAFKIASALPANSGSIPYYPEFTSVSQTTNAVTGVTTSLVSFITDWSSAYYSGSKANLDAVLPLWTMTYHVQPTPSQRGDFEDTATQSIATQIPELNLVPKSEQIVAETRKMKAVFTPELVQDLQAYQGLDAEAELTSIMNEYLGAEIDLEILDMLVAAAPTVNYWSARLGYTYDSTSQTFVNSAVNAMAYTEATWNQTIGKKITDLSNAIHAKTLKGGANFIVCSPAVSSIFESLNGFSSDGAGDDQYSSGVSRPGSFKSQYKIYKNPYMTSNVALVGFKGNNFFETGASYNPYIPFITTPTIYDPDTFVPRKGIMTRYGKKVYRPEFYSLLVIDGITNL